MNLKKNIQTYISILRGINVSGQKMIKMDALCKMYASLNLANVQSYIQSGNVIFRSRGFNDTELETSIQQKIQEDFGFEVPLMVKDLKEFSHVVMNNPFLKIRKGTEGLHVTFLSRAPDPENLNKIISASYAPDEFKVDGKIIYLHCPNGYGRTKLTNNFFESKLKVVATTRNWKTVNELLNMATALSKLES